MNAAYIKQIQNMHKPIAIIEVESVLDSEWTVGGHEAVVNLKNGDTIKAYMTHEDCAEEFLSQLVTIELRKRYDEVKSGGVDVSDPDKKQEDTNGSTDKS